MERVIDLTNESESARINSTSANEADKSVYLVN